MQAGALRDFSSPTLARLEGEVVRAHLLDLHAAGETDASVRAQLAPSRPALASWAASFVDGVAPVSYAVPNVCRQRPLCVCCLRIDGALLTFCVPGTLAASRRADCAVRAVIGPFLHNDI